MEPPARIHIRRNSAKTMALALLCLLLLPLLAFGSTSGKLRVNIRPAPAKLELSAASPESASHILQSGTSQQILFTLKNTGQGFARDIRGEATLGGDLKGIATQRRFVFPDVPAGQAVTQPVTLTADPDVGAGFVTLSVTATDGSGVSSNQVSVNVRTGAKEQPQFGVALSGLTPRRTDNTLVRPMEITEAVLKVTNTGQSPSSGVSATIKVGTNVFFIATSAKTFSLGPLKPGEANEIKFSFYVSDKAANGDPANFTLEINDPGLLTPSIHTLTFKVSTQKEQLAPPPAPVAVQVPVRVEPAKPAPQPPQEEKVSRTVKSDVDLDIPEGHAFGDIDIAVVIGNKNYQVAGVPAVEFAHNDAELIKKYLMRTMGYQEENILFYLDAPLSKMNELFGSDSNPKGRLYNYVKPGESNVFIYYTGHGAPDLNTQDQYFLPADADPHYVSATGYKLKTFYENLKTLPAKSLTIVLDTCFSGSSSAGFLFRNVSPALLRTKETVVGLDNAVILSSSAAEEVSAWYPDKGHSLFTYFFLSGLKGKADENGDGTVTVDEMGTFMRDKVTYTARRLNGTEQHPIVSGNASLPLAKFKRRGR